METYYDLDSALATGAANVKSLVIDGNRDVVWKAWPEALWTLTELEELRLNQQLSTVPPEISALAKLRVLELATAFQFFEPGLGALTSLRQLIIRGDAPNLAPDLAKLSLDRLEIAADWSGCVDVISRIAVRTNVTLTDNHPFAAEDLERQDLSAWKDLKELEIDAFEAFEPTVFERKLPRCGFAINRKRRVLWEIEPAGAAHPFRATWRPAAPDAVPWPSVRAAWGSRPRACSVEYGRRASESVSKPKCPRTRLSGLARALLFVRMHPLQPEMRDHHATFPLPCFFRSALCRCRQLCPRWCSTHRRANFCHRRRQRGSRAHGRL